MCFTCFATGLWGVSHHFGGHDKCDGFDVGNEKKDIMRCFCFLFPILCSFFSPPEKKPLFVCWSTVSRAWPRRGGAIVFVCRFNMLGFGFFSSDFFDCDGYGDGDDISRCF